MVLASCSSTSNPHHQQPTEGAVFYGSGADGPVPPEQANTTRRGVIDQFKAFIRHHSAHDKRPTDDPLSYRCVCDYHWQ